MFVQSKLLRAIEIVSLAFLLTCGFQLSAGEKQTNQAKPAKQEQVQSTTQVAAPAQKAANATAARATSNLVNINTADLDTLVTLPRIGKAIGQRIIDFRSEHGGFKKMEELMNVSGIGQKTFDRLKDKIQI